MHTEESSPVSQNAATGQKYLHTDVHHLCFGWTSFLLPAGVRDTE